MYIEPPHQPAYLIQIKLAELGYALGPGYRVTEEWVMFGPETYDDEMNLIDVPNQVFFVYPPDCERISVSEDGWIGNADGVYWPGQDEPSTTPIEMATEEDLPF